MIETLDNKRPEISNSAFIAPSACVIGDVHIGEASGIWYGAVIRGDSNSIRVGNNTNVQDNCVLHVEESYELSIGDNVTIGHRAIVHGCKIGNRVLIGMGAIIMNGAVIEDDSIIGAGALVTEGNQIPSRSLLVGMPAKVKRTLTDDEVSRILHSSSHYAALAKKYVALGKGSKGA